MSDFRIHTIIGLVTIVVASLLVVTLARAFDNIDCPDANVTMTFHDMTPATATKKVERRAITVTTYYPIKQRHIRTPVFQLDVKTRKMTLDGKPCQESE